MRRTAISLAIVALLALGAVSTAAAASPRDIYADYADNRRLDQTYSESDLRKALADTTIQGYGKPTIKSGIRPAILQQLGAVRQASGTLPFTGADLAVVTAGAGFLLLFGLGFRRLGRSTRA